MKYAYNLDKHPKFGARRDDLDPEQSGLLKITKKYLEKKAVGEAFEVQICKMLEDAFPQDVVIRNIIFESGNYNESLKMYQSFQMDALLITSSGLFCIEAKYLSNNKYIRMSGSATSKSWTLKSIKGTSSSEINGLKQNFRHTQFLEDVFNYEEIDCPVYQMTVIGGLEHQRIRVQQFIDGNLVDLSEMIDRVKYIKERNQNANVDVGKIVDIIKDWECNVPGKDKLHMVYVRNISNNKLPIRCKKLMRRL